MLPCIIQYGLGLAAEFLEVPFLKTVIFMLKCLHSMKVTNFYPVYFFWNLNRGKIAGARSVVFALSSNQNVNFNQNQLWTWTTKRSDDFLFKHSIKSFYSPVNFSGSNLCFFLPIHRVASSEVNMWSIDFFFQNA